MNWNPVHALTEELAGISVTDEQAWLEYVPLAARLAALGEPEPLRRWPGLARPFADRLDAILMERSQEGIWDLQQSVGKDLALAVIDAQDFSCFLNREQSILAQRAVSALTAWIDEAERTPLDESAAAMLRMFLRRFPLPEDDRLAVVDAPMSLGQEGIIAAAARPCPTIEAEWPPLSLPAVQLSEVYQLDAGRPSDRMKRCFGRDAVVEIPLLGKLAVSRRVDDHWRVVIDIDREDGTVPDVELLRLGRLPGQPADDAPGRWLVDVRPWEHFQRERLMEAPLVVGFRNGYRLRVK